MGEEHFEINFRSDVTVELVKASASDSDVIWAARVSTAGENSLDDVDSDASRSEGLINYLARERHGSPFEHTSMTFFISAPIFEFREFMRHRIASYNEESGRYRDLRPNFFKSERPAHIHLLTAPMSNTKRQSEQLKRAALSPMKIIRRCSMPGWPVK